MKQEYVAYYGVGSAGPSAPGGIGWEIPYIGYDGFIINHIVPAMQKGWLEFWLHNLFGTWSVLAPDQAMQFDQWVILNELGEFERITETFANSWRFMLGTFDRLEVTAYLGKLSGSVRMTSLIQENKINAWLGRLQQSIAPLLDVGMNIGFDAVATNEYTNDTYVYGAVTLIRDLMRRNGKDVYVEPLPIAAGLTWRSFNSMSTSQFINQYWGVLPNFMRANPNRHMVFLNHDYQGDYFAELKKYKDAGLTPFVADTDIRKYSYQEILNGTQYHG